MDSAAPWRNAAEAIDRLRARFGDRLTTNEAVRDAHGRGEGMHGTLRPDAVIFAASSEEVAAVVGICNETETPLIAFGVGTSLEGQVQAPFGGICLDLSGMD